MSRLTCSAISEADFLDFFDDFGANALSVIRAKLQTTSFEVVVDGVRQPHRSHHCLLVKNFTLRTLDDIRQYVRACVPLSVSGRVGVSWVSGIDPTVLKDLLALAQSQQALPYTKGAFQIQDDPALGQPFVYMLLSLFQRKLQKLPENVRLFASSLGLPSIVGIAHSADSFSKMNQSHHAARLLAPTQPSVSSAIVEGRRIEWLMQHPENMPPLRLDGNVVALLVTGVVVDIAPAWLKVVDGTHKFVWEVMRALYPTFSTAQLDLIIKSNTVEGTFALSGYLALALASEFHFNVLASRIKFYFENYFTDIPLRLNYKESAVREKFAAVVVATLHAENPAFTEDRYYTLCKRLSNIHVTSGIDGLFGMCRFLLEKPEVQAAMALSTDRNSEFYTRIADIFDANADALKKLVVFDVSTAVAFLECDPAGVIYTAGKPMVWPQLGSVQTYLAGPPGTGKTSAALTLWGDLRMDGVRCIPKGNVLLVVVSTKVERTAITPLLAKTGYCVIDYESTRPVWVPELPRLDAILATLSDMSQHYALIVTAHSVCKLLYSKPVLERAQASYNTRGTLGALRTDMFDLPHFSSRLAAVWFSEGMAIILALLSALIVNKDMTVDVLRRLAYLPVVLVDGPIDQSAITFWFDICPNLRVHMLVPQQRPPSVDVFSQLPPWLERLQVALSTPGPILVMTDRASAVELFYVALRALAPHRDIFHCTADEATFDLADTDALLTRGCIIIASPVITVCQDLQAKGVRVFYASFGGGPSSEMIRQSMCRVRDASAQRSLYCQPPHDSHVSMNKPDADTAVELLVQIMRIVNNRAATQGALFDTVRSAIPMDLSALLHDNEATAIAEHVQRDNGEDLPLAILAGINFNRPVPPEHIARVTMNFNPDVAPALSFLCLCTVRQGDRTSDREVCSNCGELPVVVVTGTTSQQPFRLAPLGNAVQKFEEGFFWKPECHLTKVKGMPHLSPLDVATISDLLRHGNQSEARRITELLSSLLATGAKLSYVEGTPGGANLPEAFKTLLNALLTVCNEKMRVAIDVLKGQTELVGLEHADLLRQMLGANGDERRSCKAAITVREFLWELGLLWNNATLDRLTVELRLVAWPLRFANCQLWKKTDPFRQLQTLSGAGGNLNRWLDAVFHIGVGVMAPARGIGSAQQLLERLSTLRLARLFALLCAISGVDQTERPLILSTRGLHIPHDRGLLIVNLVADRDDALAVLADVTSGLAALSMSGKVPDDPALVSVKDAVTLAKLTARLAFGMSLKFKKDCILRWNPAFLVTRLTVLYLRLRRDGPIPGCSADHHAWLVRLVKGELESVDDTMTPLLAVAEVPKPSKPVMPRTATVNSLGSTQPYREDAEGVITQREKDALLSYMRGVMEKHEGLKLFGTFEHCDELWSQLDAEQHALVLGGTGDTRAHLKLKLHLGKLALEILDRTKDSVLRRGFEKANNLMRQSTLDSMGSLDPGWARTGNVKESDLSESESEDEEEQERLDRANERKRKRCRFLDDEAGQDDDGDLDLVSSSMETETYD